MSHILRFPLLVGAFFRFWALNSLFLIFLSPLGLKNRGKNSFWKRIFSLWQFELFKTKSALKMKEGG
jgi:hypothetical protein